MATESCAVAGDTIKPIEIFHQVKMLANSEQHAAGHEIVRGNQVMKKSPDGIYRHKEFVK